MESDEYMRVKYKHIPEEICIRYNLKTEVTQEDYVFIRIEKGMYGLKQAAFLAYKHLKENLAQDGYSPIISNYRSMETRDTPHKTICLRWQLWNKIFHNRWC